MVFILLAALIVIFGWRVVGTLLKILMLAVFLWALCWALFFGGLIALGPQ